MLKVAICVFVLVCCSALGFAQNTCAHPIPAYNFCLTSSGTLASLPGVLDSTNPIEGWGYRYSDDSGGSGSIDIFPGSGRSYGATVKQPHGPGTLPITFDFGEVVETVTATHRPNSISFKMSMRSCSPGCLWFGQIYRAANLVLNGNPQSYFGTSATAALAYFQSGVVLTGGCDGIAADVTQIDPQDPVCGTAPATFQQGALYGVSGFSSRNGKPSGATFTYLLF